MKIIKHIENLKGLDAQDVMSKVIYKVFYSAYGKDFKKIIITPIKDNNYCDLQIEIHYVIDKKRKDLDWKP